MNRIHILLYATSGIVYEFQYARTVVLEVGLANVVNDCLTIFYNNSESLDRSIEIRRNNNWS